MQFRLMVSRCRPVWRVSALWCLCLCLGACSGTRRAAVPITDIGAARPLVIEPSQVTEPVSKSPTAGELALAQGIRSYQSALYPQAEAQLKAALKEGLGAAVDVSTAHKYLAFIYCTSTREGLCQAAFKAAQQADPAFALSKTEAGHPMWDKAYKKALGLK